MGLNMLGAKKLHHLREVTGLNIDQAVTSSHVESGRWWWFRVIEETGHWHGWYDRKDGTWSEKHDLHDAHWSSCSDLP